MKFLTEEDAKHWSEARHLEVTPGRYLTFDSDSMHGFTVSLEETPSRVIALADYLAPTWEDVPFHGALLWIRARGIWSDHSEKAGAMIFRQMRVANGETSALEDRPACLFDADEISELHSYFVIPMLFGWDAFLVPEGQDYFVFISHDGIAEIVCRTLNRSEELRQRLHAWNPRDDDGWYSRIAGT